MSSDYKIKENKLKKIIKQNLKPTDRSDQIQLTIFYKTKKLKNLLISNNVKPTSLEDQCNVVYKYNCPDDGCSSTESIYIGYTTNTLKTRMSQHHYYGSIRKHSEEKHKIRISYDNIIRNTKNLKKDQNKEDLIILEALLIKSQVPNINMQEEGSYRILKIF